MLNSSGYAETRPDLILTNAKIWTGSSTSAWAESLAITGNRISAVGYSVDVLKLRGPRTRLLGLSGKLVVPGFIDNHTHFLEGGFHLLGIDLRSAKDPKEFAQRIGIRARALPPGKWITGGNWDHESWSEPKLPTKELIDAVTPATPVFVRRLDGHMALANSLALLKANITRQTADPPGGSIVRDPRTGEPTGILKDAAMELVYAQVPQPTGRERDEALHTALREAARLGVTSIQDITSSEDLATYQRAHQQRRLTVRVFVRTPLSQWETQTERLKKQSGGDDWLRLGGFKAFMDGSLGSSTALFFEPYADAPGNFGLLSDEAIDQLKLKERMFAADRTGLQLSIHAIGDRANALLLDLYEELAHANGTRDRRCRIEHAQHLRTEDMPRFARLGVIASVQPVHLADDGRWAERRLGPDRIKGAYAFASLLAAGTKLCFGTDWPVAPLNPLLGIEAAVTRRTIDGNNPKGWIPSEKISLEEALRCYTVNSAYASFEEKEKGRLETGLLADLVVLDRDIFSLEPESVSQAKVVYTIVDGKIVFP